MDYFIQEAEGAALQSWFPLHEIQNIYKFFCVSQLELVLFGVTRVI